MIRRFVPGTLLAILAGCAEAPPFDSAAFVRERWAERLGAEAASGIEIPFELDPEILAEIEESLDRRGTPRQRARQVVDLIFGSLGLEYALYPTRTAAETFRSRRGNCLSFVNLFVGIARHLGLDPFYVEVVDQQGWSYRDGMVVSRGHIVAGMMIEGKLETFDFLPYRPKSYRDLRPLDDQRAIAHFYNNLGAEALIGGDPQAAARHLALAARIAPEWVTGLNNLGISQARLGDLDSALETYRRGLRLEPGNVAVLTNLARLHQQEGRHEAAEGLLEQVRRSRHASPFFYVYQGERALARGELQEALDHLRQGLRRDSEVPEVHIALVKLYLALGDLDRSRHHLRRALKLDSKHPDAREFRNLLAGDGL